jgi:hypothetical protein
LRPRIPAEPRLRGQTGGVSEPRGPAITSHRSLLLLNRSTSRSLATICSTVNFLPAIDHFHPATRAGRPSSASGPIERVSSCAEHGVHVASLVQLNSSDLAAGTRAHSPTVHRRIHEEPAPRKGRFFCRPLGTEPSGSVWLTWRAYRYPRPRSGRPSWLWPGTRLVCRGSASCRSR